MKISVNYSRTINLGNYSSMKVEAGAEDTVRDEESVTSAYDRLWGIVKLQVSNQGGV